MVREVVSVESRIEQVTVYASGARVRRVATLARSCANASCVSSGCHSP